MEHFQPPNPPDSTLATAQDWDAIKANARIFADQLIDEMQHLLPVLDENHRSMIRATINAASFQIIGDRRAALLSFIVDLLNIDPANDDFLYHFDEGNIDCMFESKPDGGTP